MKLDIEKLTQEIIHFSENSNYYYRNFENKMREHHEHVSKEFQPFANRLIRAHRNSGVFQYKGELVSIKLGLDKKTITDINSGSIKSTSTNFTTPDEHFYIVGSSKSFSYNSPKNEFYQRFENAVDHWTIKKSYGDFRVKSYMNIHTKIFSVFQDKEYHNPNGPAKIIIHDTGETIRKYFIKGIDITDWLGNKNYSMPLSDKQQYEMELKFL